jgi:CHASE3 domain sensor protein
VFFNRLNFKSKFVFAFAAIIAVFGVATFFVHRNLGEIEVASARARASIKIMLTTSEAAKKMLDASAVVRGFPADEGPGLRGNLSERS